MDEQIIAIYCVCDDLLRAMHYQADPPCQMSDAEVMTTAIVAALLFLATFLYVQLQRSLRAQVDVGLEVVAAQALLTLTEEGGQLAFQDIEDNPEIIRNLNDNYVIYLLARDGSLWDQLGNDDEAPTATPSNIGHTTLLVKNAPWRVYNQPVSIGRTEGLLQVVQELEPVEQILESLLAQMLFGVPMALVLAGVGGFFLAAHALRPIEHITRTAQAIQASIIDELANVST